jgi:hypothetical protein
MHAVGLLTVSVVMDLTLGTFFCQRSLADFCRIGRLRATRLLQVGFLPAIIYSCCYSVLIPCRCYWLRLTVQITGNKPEYRAACGMLGSGLAL